MTVLRVRDLATREPGVTAFMRHRAESTGVAQAPGEWAPLHTVSPYLVLAVVKAEDPFFFRHRGIDWAMLRQAVRDAARRRGVRGASTMTQQLARNLYLTPARALGRKAREALIAMRLERALGKARIIELYLNVAEWGDGVWGVHAAARHYFGRTPGELDAWESALLASLLPAPRRALAGPRANRAWWVQRYALFHMWSLELLSLKEWRDGVGRATSLCHLTHSGLTIPEAVERLRAAFPAPVPPRPPAVTAGELVAGRCGMDRHVPFEAELRRWDESRKAGRPRPAAHTA